MHIVADLVTRGVLILSLRYCPVETAVVVVVAELMLLF